MPDIRSPFKFTSTNESRTINSLLQNTKSNNDKVVERTSMTEFEKQIEKNIEIYIERKPTSKINKIKATLTDASTKSNSSLSTYTHQKILVKQSKSKHKHNSPCGLNSHHKGSTVSRSELQSIEEEVVMTNKSKRHGKPAKRKPVSKTSFKVI